MKRYEWQDDILDWIEGVHVHNLCENDSFALERTLAALEQRFGDVLPKVQWINMGGGHHITRRATTWTT
jgi:carboxynorspermidine decarboxylase